MTVRSLFPGHVDFFGSKNCVRGRISKSAKTSWDSSPAFYSHHSCRRYRSAPWFHPAPCVLLIENQIMVTYLMYSSSLNQLVFNCNLDQIKTWSWDLETPRNPPSGGAFIKCKFCNSCQLLMYCLDKMTINYIDFHH